MSRNRIVLITLIAGLVIVAASAGYVAAQFTAYAHGNYGSRYGNSSAGGYGGSASPDGMGNGGYGSSAAPGGMGNAGGAGMEFSSSSLADAIAKRVGTRLAGKAPQTVSTGQARTLSEQVPAGARVDKAAGTITFTGATVSFTVVAIPPFGPDMTFGIAGLTNPTVIVATGARVTVRFINNDTDEAHGWLVTTHKPPFAFGQPVTPSIPGAYAGVIGDPTAAGDGSDTITFLAGTAGSYEYICPMPGHAQMGMHGGFVVR